MSLSADSANFEQGMKRAQRTAATSATGINKSMGLIKSGIAGFVSGLSVAMFTTAIKNGLDYAASLGEVSQQIGVTTKDLQTLRYAASQVGVSQEEVDKGLSKLTITLGQVAAGAKAPTKALQAIGISAKDLAGVDTGDAFRMIADGLEKVTDRSQRAAVEVALFGRTGAKLDTMLSGGSAALNELSAAAETLGIVLSDEQIQKADETADKLDALQTVLKARIAGVVADNADSIIGFADSLVYLVGKIGSALEWLGRLRAELNLAAQMYSLPAQIKRGLGVATNAQGYGQLGTSVTVKLGAAKPAPPPKPKPAPISQFLGSGGGGSPKTPRAKADHSAEDAKRKQQEALRDAYQFSEDDRRAQMDVLRAQQDLATHYIDRNAIAIQLLDLEQQGYQAELDFKVQSGELSAAQAQQLKIKYDQVNQLQRDKVIQDDISQALEDSARLDGVSFDLEKDRLQSQLQLATTAKEQRDIQLRLLDLAYRQEKARLEAVLADEQAAPAAREEARRRLSGLNQTYGNDRKAVIQNTQGPLASFAATLPSTAEQWNEALENVAVNGIQSVTDGLLGIIDGTKSAGEAFRDMAQSIISDLLRIMIQKALVQAIGMATGTPTIGMSGGGGMGGGLPGFATGGSFSIMGNHGRDNNLLSLNGLPIAKVSHGERLSVGNDNSRNVSAPVTIHVSGPMTDSQARRTGMQVAAGYQAEINRARTKGIS